MSHHFHHQPRHPLYEIQEDGNNTVSNMSTIPRVTVTTSPVVADTSDENRAGEKLPTLTTPPQTVTRSISNSALRVVEAHAAPLGIQQQGHLHQHGIDTGDVSFINTKNPKKAKRSKTLNSSLLSPAFSSPPRKAEKSNSLPLPPELPKFTSTTKVKASTKKERTQEDIDELNRQVPPPELMPKVIDTSTDFTKKPAYSYAMLIGMSILRAPNRRLTLSQIYNWISDTFKYYKRGDVGWQNSVRHNLSLNKAFVKSARSKDRKGHFWHIAKGYEYQFYLGKGAAPISAAQQQQLQQQQQLYEQQQKMILLQQQQEQEQLAMGQNLNGRENGQHNSEGDDEEGPSFDDDEYEDEGDETVRIVQQTPRSKIINRRHNQHSYYDEDEHFASTGEQSSVLQRHMLQQGKRSRSQFEDQDTDLAGHPPIKRGTMYFSSVAGNGRLSTDTIPNLQPPSPSWAASASGDRVIFGLLKTPPKMSSHSTTSHMTSQSSIFDSPLPIQHATHPSSVQQANRYQQFTSSFSCISNFDLSPLKGTETGPLLEPLTPAQNRIVTHSRDNSTSSTHIKTGSLDSNNSITTDSGLGEVTSDKGRTTSSHDVDASRHSSTTSVSADGANRVNDEDGNAHNNSHTGVNTTLYVHNNALATPSILKTPFNRVGNSNIKTPGSSVMKKIWNSPSYLDDFYTSPVVNKSTISFEEEDVVVCSARAFGSPAKGKKERR